jgi:prolyl 4-hydroxylase
MIVKEYPRESFIFGWYLPLQFCDDVLKWSEENSDLTRDGGCLTVEGNPIKDFNYKQSSDKDFNIITAFNLYKKYIAYLNQGVKAYAQLYSSFNLNGPIADTEGVNFQHYKPGEGFKAWHSERLVYKKTTRVMVFMTYLNNVKDGGGTEFLNQKLKTKAEKGLTLLWPSDWTHTHRGIITESQDKYILTGWLNYERR